MKGIEGGKQRMYVIGTNKENITKLTDEGFDVPDIIYVRLAGDVVC